MASRVLSVLSDESDCPEHLRITKGGWKLPATAAAAAASAARKGPQVMRELREKIDDILKLKGSGLSTKQIAHRYGCSGETIATILAEAGE